MSEPTKEKSCTEKKEKKKKIEISKYYEIDIFAFIYKQVCLFVCLFGLREWLLGLDLFGLFGKWSYGA